MCTAYIYTYIHTYITLHYITLHYITLHYINTYIHTLHYITLHYITLHYITLHYITLHYIHTYIHYIHSVFADELHEVISFANQVCIYPVAGSPAGLRVDAFLDSPSDRLGIHFLTSDAHQSGDLLTRRASSQVPSGNLT